MFSESMEVDLITELGGKVQQWEGIICSEQSISVCADVSLVVSSIGRGLVNTFCTLRITLVLPLHIPSSRECFTIGGHVR